MSIDHRDGGRTAFPSFVLLCAISMCLVGCDKPTASSSSGGGTSSPPPAPVAPAVSVSDAKPAQVSGRANYMGVGTELNDGLALWHVKTRTLEIVLVPGKVTDDERQRALGPVPTTLGVHMTKGPHLTLNFVVPAGANDASATKSYSIGFWEFVPTPLTLGGPLPTADKVGSHVDISGPLEDGGAITGHARPVPASTQAGTTQPAPPDMLNLSYTLSVHVVQE